MRILALAESIPRPDTGSGDRRFAAIVQMLAARADVALCCDEDPRDGEETRVRYLAPLEAAGVHVVGCGPDAYVRAVRGAVYSMLFVEFWYRAAAALPYLRRVQPWTRVVVDSVDVHFAREAGAVRLGLLDAAEVDARKRRELAVYRAADHVVVVSDEDEAALRQEGGIARITRIPNAIRWRERHTGTRPPVLVFVGGFAHAPNTDAVHWFADDILPRVRDVVPDAVFRVVGHAPPSDVVALGARLGVEIVGHVADTAPYLAAAAVSVAPLRYGAGMKGKVTEAMASGIPVVTTSIGAQGLRAEPGVHLLVSDSADGFAAAVIRCLRDPGWAAQLGLAGQRHVDTICGETAVAAAVDDLLRPASRPPSSAHARLHAYRTVRGVARALKLRR